MIRVLFVDDEVDLCDVYEVLFSSEKIEVITFSDPLEAINEIKQTSFDIAFLDFRMPQMNGLKLREELPSSTPCFLVTGELDMEVPANFLDLLRKPFKKEEFLATINKHFPNLEID